MTKLYYVQVAVYVLAENTTHALSIVVDRLDTQFDTYDVFDGNVVGQPEEAKP